MASRNQVFFAQQNPSALAALISTAKVVAGGAAEAVAKFEIPTEVIAILAITTATGAVATKFLLAPTTDYTVNADKSGITFVTNQSANTLIVLYR